MSHFSKSREQTDITLGAFVTIFSSIFGFLVTHEVSIADSLKLCTTLFLDITTGALLWIALDKKRIYTVFEVFGVGLTIGSSLNAIASVIFYKTDLHFQIQFVLLAGSIWFFVSTREKRSTVVVDGARPELSFGLIAITLILLSGDRPYLWLASLMVLAAFAIYRSLRTKSIFLHRSILQIYVLITVFVALSVTSIFEKFFYEKRSLLSYVPGWDGVVSEASRKSIIEFGPFDNILFSNTKFAYYWFGDALTGSVSARSRVSDWVVITQFLPVVVAFAALSLLICVLLRQTNGKFKSVGLLGTIATIALVGSPTNMFYLANMSQLVAVLLIMFIIFLLAEYSHNDKYLYIFALVFASTLLVITKITMAVPIISGISLGLAQISLLKSSRRHFHQLSIFVLSTFLSAGFAYLIFIKPAPDQRGSYSDFSVAFSDALFGIHAGPYIINLLIASAPFIIIVLIYFKNFELSFFNVTLIAISTVSLILALFMKFNFSHANIYLIIPHMLCLGLLSGLAMYEKSNEFVCATSRQLTAATSVIIAAVSVGFFSTLRLHFYNYQFVLTDTIIVFFTSLPTIFALTVGLIARNYSRIRLRKNVTFVLLSALIFSMTGSYVAHSLRGPMKQLIYSNKNWDLEIEDVEGKYKQLAPVIKKLTEIASPNDVIASNSMSEKGLLAAGSGTRNFAASYFPNLWGGVAERHRRQVVFGEMGNVADYEYLRLNCVTLFYVDKTELQGKPPIFGDLGSIVLSDEFGQLLKLSNKTTLPDTCNK